MQKEDPWPWVNFTVCSPLTPPHHPSKTTLTIESYLSVILANAASRWWTILNKCLWHQRKPGSTRWRMRGPCGFSRYWNIGNTGCSVGWTIIKINYSFFQNDKSRTWEENQRPIITVTTVEDFWSLYNHIETPSKLPFGSDYSLFKV